MSRVARAGVAMAAALVLGGCAGLPRSGPVERVADAPGQIRVTEHNVPAGPKPGATPQQVVKGYLDAMLAYPEATSIVESFLTSEARAGWSSSSGIAVYSRLTSKVGTVTSKAAEVRIRTRETLTIDRLGRATVATTDRNRTIELKRVDGEWRVANPVQGYLVSKRFADEHLRSYPLWFFDESGTRLVPELAHAIVMEQLPLVLVRRLAAGPQESTLRTFVPPSSDLRVKMTGHVVEIDIQGRPEGPEDKLTAQLLSSLRGAPGLDGVRILVEGVLQGEFDTSDAVVGFGAGPSALRFFAIRSGRVVEIAQQTRPISGPWGKAVGDAVAIAVDGTLIAARMRDGSTVTVGPRAGGETTTLTGSGFVDPTWDVDRGLWLVDNPGGAARVRVWRGGVTRAVATDALGEVQSFAVSPDRSHYAAVVQSAGESAVVVGDIQHGADGEPARLLAPILVSGGRTGEREVAWSSAFRVGFLADGRSGSQLYSVGLDGTDVAGGSALPGGIASWAGTAEDRADRWALDEKGRLWRRSPGGAWARVSSDTFSSLTAGR